MSLGKRVSAVLILAASLLSFVGCKSPSTGQWFPSLARPNWAQPGPAEIQQAQATDYDPYPQVEAGPRLDGARPQSFEHPPAEVLNVQPETSSGSSGRSTWRWPWQ